MSKTSLCLEEISVAPSLSTIRRYRICFNPRMLCLVQGEFLVYTNLSLSSCNSHCHGSFIDDMSDRVLEEFIPFLPNLAKSKVSRLCRSATAS